MAPQESPDATAIARAASGSATTFHPLALLISNGASPPVMTSLAMFVLAGHLHRPGALLWAGAFVLVGVVPPLLFLFAQLRRGRIRDLDLTRRRERTRPLALTVVCLLGAGIVLQMGGAPLPLTALSGLIALHGSILLVITGRWKISVHCAAACGTGSLLWILHDTPLPLLGLGAGMIWSRLLLQRHTPAQVAAGSVLGAVLFAALAGPLAG
jgi:membrane-associated phospholipid phosphatase